MGNLRAGFTLLEVLVAMLLTAFALLGLAKTQIQAMQFAANSLQQTIAIIEANNVLERIWPDLCALQGGRTANFGTAKKFVADNYRMTGQQMLPNITITLPSYDFSVSPYLVKPAQFIVEASWIDTKQGNQQQDKFSIASSFPWLRNGNPDGC